MILACVSGGLRRLLAARRESVEGSLVAMVPVSTRAEGESEELGNQISGMLVSLASDIEDPVARLDAISESTRVAKEQEKLHGGRLLGDLAQIAVPALASRVARARGRDPAVRQDAPALQRHGVERPGPRRPALPGREPGGGHLPGRPHGGGHRAQRDGLLVSRAASTSACWPAAACFRSSTKWRCTSTMPWASWWPARSMPGGRRPDPAPTAERRTTRAGG